MMYTIWRDSFDLTDFKFHPLPSSQPDWLWLELKGENSEEKLFCERRKSSAELWKFTAISTNTPLQNTPTFSTIYKEKWEQMGQNKDWQQETVDPPHGFCSFLQIHSNNNNIRPKRWILERESWINASNFCSALFTDGVRTIHPKPVWLQSEPWEDRNYRRIHGGCRASGGGLLLVLQRRWGAFTFCESSALLVLQKEPERETAHRHTQP